MRYGFYLPTRGETATPEALETLVQRGESLGFSSVMIADHVVFPVTINSKYPYTVTGAFPGQGDALEQLTLMAFIAGKTRTLRLVSSVMIVPHRNPVVTAKMLATIDVLSRGRVTVGVGVGWLREEFQALGAPDFDRRGSVSDEYIRIMKTLWTECPASFAGEFYRFEAVRCLPAPVQKPHPPIWVGGHSRAALRRTARFGAAWHPINRPPAELRASRAELARLCQASGRAVPPALTLRNDIRIVRPGQSVPTSTHGGRVLAGEPAALIDQLAELADCGVEHLVLEFLAADGRELDAQMTTFAERVRPRFV